MSFCIYDGMNTYGKLQGKNLDIHSVIRILLLSSIFGNESNKKIKITNMRDDVIPCAHTPGQSVTLYPHIRPFMQVTGPDRVEYPLFI